MSEVAIPFCFHFAVNSATLWYSAPAGCIHNWYINGTSYLTLTTTALTCTVDVIAYSDVRLKADIQTIPDALDKVCRMRGVSFTRTDIPDTTRRHIGLIAQEVEKIIPEVVTEDKETGIKALAYQNMVGVLIEAIKEQQATITQLQSRLDVLEKKFE